MGSFSEKMNFPDAHEFVIYNFSSVHEFIRYLLDVTRLTDVRSTNLITVQFLNNVKKIIAVIIT